MQMQKCNMSIIILTRISIVSYAKLTIATVEVWVGAGSAVLWSQVDLGVKVLRHGGIALLAGSLLGV